MKKSETCSRFDRQWFGSLIAWIGYVAHVQCIPWYTCTIACPCQCQFYRGIMICLSVCVCQRAKNACDGYQLFAHVTHGCSAVILWRRCDMLLLCTSGFIDVVTFLPCPTATRYRTKQRNHNQNR